MPGKRYKLPAIKPVIAINAVVAGLFGVGYLASRFGWSFLLAPVGLIVFFLPGLNTARSLELLTGSRQDVVTKTLWVIIMSLVISPLFGLTAVMLAQGSVIDYTLPGFLGYWALSLIGVVIFERFSKLPPSRSLKIDLKELRLVIGVFLVALAGALIIYPFIPEADSYTYLMRLRDIQADPTLFPSEGRPLFLVLAQIFNSVTGLSPYWLFKLGLPLLGVTMTLTAYLLTSAVTKQRWLRVTYSLLPLCFPVVFQELLISRPQSIFLIIVGPALYFIGKLSIERANPRHIYLLLLLSSIGGIGLKIHTLFALILAVGIAGLVVFYIPRIIRRPIDSVLIGIGVMVAIYPWVAKTGIVGDMGEVIRLFIETAKNNHFVWWFLDHYRNVDGNEAGWPGLTGLLYYGYNLGLFLPGLLVLALFWRNKRDSVRTNGRILWPLWTTVAIFFVIAEVAPRFNFAYLPDRAWLVIALAFSLTIPFLSAPFLRKDWPKPYQLGLIAIVVVATVSSWAVSYGKDGWINARDYSAISYLREQTPKESVFLSQGSNHVLIRYFGERTMVRPLTDIFTTTDNNAVEDYFSDLREQRQRSLDANAGRLASLRKELRRVQTKLSNETMRDDPLQLAQEQLVRQEYLLAMDEREIVLKSFAALDRPTYILYSRNKFKSIYASRSWWKTSNFAGAQLEKFSNRYPVVFDQNGVTIWKVRD